MIAELSCNGENMIFPVVRKEKTTGMLVIFVDFTQGIVLCPGTEDYSKGEVGYFDNYDNYDTWEIVNCKITG